PRAIDAPPAGAALRAPRRLPGVRSARAGARFHACGGGRVGAFELPRRSAGCGSRRRRRSVTLAPLASCRSADMDRRRCVVQIGVLLPWSWSAFAAALTESDAAGGIRA